MKCDNCGEPDDAFCSCSRLETFPPSIGILVAVTGDESAIETEALAFAMLARSHPVECWRHDPEKFWQFFQVQCSGVSREEMEARLERIESDMNAEFDDEGGDYSEGIPEAAYCGFCSGSGFSEGHCGPCPYCMDGIADPNFW